MPLEPAAVSPPTPLAAPTPDEERFRVVTDALQGFVYDADLRTGLVTRTAGMARILGWSPDEVPSTTEWWRSVLHPDDVRDLASHFEERLADPACATMEAEYRVRHRDGHWVWVLDRMRIVRDGAGMPLRFVGLTTDVTDRRRAERVVRDTEHRLAQILEVSPVPLVELDADGCVTFVNVAATRALGVGRAAIVGSRYDDPGWALATPDGVPIPRERMPVTRALAGETVRGMEVLIATPGDGARRIVELHAAPLRDEQGRITGVISAFDDVTLRHAAAEERERLLAAEQRAREEADRKRRQADFLAEASRLLSASLDYEATLRTLAAAAVPTLGDWCAVDMLVTPRAPVAAGEPAPDWPPEVRRLAVAHEDPAKVQWAWELEQRAPQDWSAPTGLPRVLREGATEFYPVIDDAMLVASAKDEVQLALLREINFSAFICVPLVARGHVLGALTLCHTDSRRHYDEDDRALAEDLARRAAVAVDNARLYGDAVQANQAKADFLAVMSHELRTPLNAILGYAGLLEAEVAGALTDGQRGFVVRGRDAAQRLLALVDDLLTFAKLEVGRVTVDVRPVGVRALVEQVVPLVAPQATARGVAVSADVGDVDRALRAAADQERAVQVLLNLLGNAVKFTAPGGSIAVTVACPDAATVHVVVRDTGIGIAAADLERVFEPFVQLEEGRTRTRGGTGLGLAISRDLARAMGGDVLADSTPGAGSTFTLVLPRADAAVRAPVAR